MKWLKYCSVAILLAAALPAPAQDAAAEHPERTKEQAAHDAKLLADLHAEHAEAFDGIDGESNIDGHDAPSTLEKCAESYAVLARLDEAVLPTLRPELARIYETWGNEPTEDQMAVHDFELAQFVVNQSPVIEWNIQMAAADNDNRAAQDLPEEYDEVANRYRDLAQGVVNADRTRKANAELLASRVKTGYSPDMIDFFTEGIRVDKLKEAKALLEWAVKFDPSNAYAVDRLATIDADIDALAEAIETEIDARKWAGDADGAPDHAGAALAFLRDHPNWGRNDNGTEVLAVAVRGDWIPGERDFLGRIISWGLPVHVAAIRPDIKEKNRARVYELTVLTQQAPSPAKQPPFVGYWVGDSWYIRPAAVPQP